MAPTKADKECFRKNMQRIMSKLKKRDGGFKGTSEASKQRRRKALGRAIPESQKTCGMKVTRPKSKTITNKPKKKITNKPTKKIKKEKK